MFAGLTGNDQAKEQLKRLIASGRVPRSLLFAGPEGVGKRLFAFGVAKALMCSSAKGHEGCGQCSICSRITEIIAPPAEKGEEYDRVFFGNHADVGLVVPYKRNLRVGSIRALEREAQFRPYEAPIRLFIINDAEKMNDASANALLKTLEEPADTTYLVLIASRPDSLLPTIRSRSQVIRFTPVQSNAIEALLSRSHGFSAVDARLASKLCGGCIGKAVGMDLAKFKYMRDHLTKAVANSARGRGLAEVLQIAEQLNTAANKDDFELNLAILESLAHDVWLIAAGAGDEAIANVDIAGEIRNIARGLPSGRVAGWLAEIETLRENLKVNINKKIAADDLFMKMAA
jgi:DNA polymerase-3 subunit delta'